MDKSSTKFKRYTVTSALPYANGPIHIGHLAGVYVPADMRLEAQFDMPDDAVHTSGLAWDGSTLWAGDYISNRAYSIDLDASLKDGRAKVNGSFETTLKGTSAACLVPLGDVTCLAV